MLKLYCTYTEVGQALPDNMDKEIFMKNFDFRRAFGGGGNRLAFTLAEVLITLGIIGVVAAVTLPTLVANYQKKVWVNQLKKASSTLNQGFKSYMAKTGCTDDIVECGFGWSGNDAPAGVFEKNVQDNFKVLTYEDCPYPGGCRKKFASYMVSKSLNPVNYDEKLGADASFAFLLSDGAVFLTVLNYIGYNIIYDVNGMKGPNVYGRDIYEFTLLPDGSVVPWLSSKHLDWLAASGPEAQELVEAIREEVKNSGCGKYGEIGLPSSDNSSGSDFGSTCADRIMQEGWKMNY